jgi:hypothetical protein
MRRKQHWDPICRGPFDVSSNLSHAGEASVCSRPSACGAWQRDDASQRGTIKREHGQPVEPARAVAAAGGWIPAPVCTFRSYVGKPNGGSTPVQRAMIALDSSVKVVSDAHREDQSMKHLLTGVAVVAALALSGPVGAQPASPSGGNAMGMPGPNPGGPGLTPYSTGQSRPTAAPSPSAPAPAPSAAMPPPSMTDTTSAMPPKHRHARAASHGKMAGHHRGKGPQLTGSTANQLNQEELARLQAGNFSTPAAPPAPGMPPPPRGSGRSPAGGAKAN